MKKLAYNSKSEKVGLKLNIQKTKIMASGHITSWQIDGETTETVTHYFGGAPKSLQMVTAAMKLKDALFLGNKTTTNLDSILKRDITLLTKVHLVKAMAFPIVMHGCESWITKKAEHQRLDAFQLWRWRTLEIPLDCKEIKPVNPKGNQS